MRLKDAATQFMTGDARFQHLLPLLLGTVAALAWMAMLGFWPGTGASALCLSPRPSMTGLAANIAWRTASDLAPVQLLMGSLAMVAAMVAPLWLQPLAHVMWRSFDTYRIGNAVLCAVAGMLAWTFALALISAGAHVAAVISANMLPAGWPAVALALMVAAWRISTSGIAAQYRCHKTYQLRPFWPLAQVDAGLFGLRAAAACMRACGPAMILPWFSDQPLVCMVAVTVIAVYDRYSFRPDHRISAAGYAAIALLELLPQAA
jgi:hypothetical protein